MFLARSRVLLALWGPIFQPDASMYVIYNGWMYVCGCECMHIWYEWKKPIQNEMLGVKEGFRSLNDG